MTEIEQRIDALTADIEWGQLEGANGKSCRDLPECILGLFTASDGWEARTWTDRIEHRCVEPGIQGTNACPPTASVLVAAIDLATGEVLDQVTSCLCLMAFEAFDQRRAVVAAMVPHAANFEPAFEAGWVGVRLDILELVLACAQFESSLWHIVERFYGVLASSVKGERERERLEAVWAHRDEPLDDEPRFPISVFIGGKLYSLSEQDKIRIWPDDRARRVQPWAGILGVLGVASGLGLAHVDLGTSDSLVVREAPTLLISAGLLSLLTAMALVGFRWRRSRRLLAELPPEQIQELRH